MARRQSQFELPPISEDPTIISISGLTEPPQPSSEPEGAEPPVSEESGDSTSASPENPPPTSEDSMPLDGTGALPLLVEEQPPVRRIENFLLYPSDSDQYRLAWLLTEEVPSVRVLTQQAVTVTAADPAPSAETEAIEPAATETAADNMAAEDTAAQNSTEDTAASENTTVIEENTETQTAEQSTSAITDTIIIPARYMDAKGVVSLYYKDLSDGETWVFNPDEIHYVASMIKAVYIYTLLRAADEGKADLNKTVIYDSESMYRIGSGNFDSVPDGKQFTVWELIEQTLISSDNTAYGMLQDLYGYQLFTEAMEAAGLPSVYRNWWHTPIEQYGQFFEVLAVFLTSDSENGRKMCDLMCRSTQTVMLKNALKPERVAHKYGWDVGAYCDGAVVLNEEHPYILIFMSNLDEGHQRQENTDFIYEVGGLVKRIHDKKYEDAKKENETDQKTDAETLPL